MLISFEGASGKMEKEYNSITNQSCARQYLRGLNLNKILETESCGVQEDIEKLRDIRTLFTAKVESLIDLENRKRNISTKL